MAELARNRIPAFRPYTIAATNSKPAETTSVVALLNHTAN